MADIFAVIADPTRRELLNVLHERRASPPVTRGLAASAESAASAGPVAAGEISVGEMVAELGVSQPTVSKHLRVLRDAGLVHVREEGQHRYYSIDDVPLGEIASWLSPFVAGVPTASAGLSPDGDVVDDDVLAAADAVATVPGMAGSWTSPVPVPAPLRRAAENLPAADDVGASLGRAVAQAQSRILDPVKKRLGHREQG